MGELFGEGENVAVFGRFTYRSVTLGKALTSLDPDVVLHQSPDLPWGGEFRGQAGYENWARQMSQAFDRLDVKQAGFLTDGDTVVITCRLITRSRASGETLDLPMTQVVRVRGKCIVELRPSYRTWPGCRSPLWRATPRTLHQPAHPLSPR